MKTIGLNHYNLRAPRALLEALCTFYCEVVGLEVGHRPPFRSSGYWLYAGGRPILHLTERGNEESQPAQPSTTFDHAAFDCVDRAGFELRLAERGIRYERSRVPHTGEIQLFFQDVAGNGVELNFAADEAD